MAELTLGVLGLVGLFNTCLEGYKICLSIKDSDDDLRILRTRMYMEKERFLNIGRTCGLLEPKEERKTESLRQFLAEDPFRRKAISDTLQLIEDLLEKAEDLNRKYETQNGEPEELRDKDSLSDRFRQLRTSLRRGTWSVRDKAAYEDVLKHLTEFNDTLRDILPGPLQEFLKTVLPATICASSANDELSNIEKVSIGQAFLKSQVEWSSAIQGVVTVSNGPEIDLESDKMKNGSALSKDRSRYLVKGEQGSSLLLEWTLWEQDSDESLARLARIAGLLAGEKNKELRMLPCAGYSEQNDDQTGKLRRALVYRFNKTPRKVKSLHDLLDTFKTVQLPPLEIRLALARSLCRAMLLYHSSGWIHHDFRSQNIVFTEGGGDSINGERQEFQGLDLAQPYVVGFGHARDEAEMSLMFANKKAISKTLAQQKRYWSPDYLISSEKKRTNRSFQRSHDIYSLGCVMLEIGVWRPLESYTWEKAYEEDQKKWFKRLLREESKLKAMCGSRYAAAVVKCLTWTAADIATDVQAFAFDLLLKLEEIIV